MPALSDEDVEGLLGEKPAAAPLKGGAVTDPDLLSHLESSASASTAPKPGAAVGALAGAGAPVPKQGTLAAFADATKQAAAGAAADPDAAVRQVVKGIPLLGGAANKFAAGMDAGTQPVLGRGSSAPTFGERFTANLGAENAKDTSFEQQYPETAKAANVGGAVLGIAGALRIPGVPTAMGVNSEMPLVLRGLFGGGTGATVNAADAVIRGEDPKAAATIGGIIGGAAPVVGAGIGATMRGVANRLTPVPNEIADVGPLGRRWLAEDITRGDAAAGAQRVGPNGFFGDLTEGLTDRTGGVANVADRSGNLVRGAYNARDAADRGRIEQTITNVMGPRVDLATITRGARAARGAAADPLYTAWRNTVVPETPQMQALLQRPSVQRALPEAERLAGDEGNALRDANGHLTAQSWDYINQAIYDIERQAGRGTNQARIAGNLRHQITDAIDNHPDPTVAGVWQQARQAWADPTTIMEAREAGQSAFTKGQRADEMAHAVAQMTQPQRMAFQEGARDAAAEVMDASARGDTTARNMFRAPVNARKLEMMVGPQRAQELTDSMEQEAALKGQHQRVIGNSVTANRLQQIGAVTPNPNAGAIGYLNQLNVTRPSTWFPGLNRSNVISNAMEPAYAAAREQIAPLLTTAGNAREQLAQALQGYAQRMGANQRMGSRADEVAAALMAGPGVQQLRRKNAEISSQPR